MRITVFALSLYYIFPYFFFFFFTFFPTFYDLKLLPAPVIGTLDDRPCVNTCMIRHDDSTCDTDILWRGIIFRLCILNGAGAKIRIHTLVTQCIPTTLQKSPGLSSGCIRFDPSVVALLFFLSMFRKRLFHTIPPGSHPPGRAKWTISVKSWKKGSKSGIKRGWITHSSKRQYGWSFFLQVFGKNLRDYCDNSSLVGFQYLVEPRRSRIERWIYFEWNKPQIHGFIWSTFFCYQFANSIFFYIE